MITVTHRFGKVTQQNINTLSLICELYHYFYAFLACAPRVWPACSSNAFVSNWWILDCLFDECSFALLQHI